MAGAVVIPCQYLPEFARALGRSEQKQQCVWVAVCLRRFFRTQDGLLAAIECESMPLAMGKRDIADRFAKRDGTLVNDSRPGCAELLGCRTCTGQILLVDAGYSILGMSLE